MKPVVTAARMREAEQQFWDLEADVDLMARAADGLVQAIRRDLRPARVLVVVGPGNNGGDGLFAAATLARELPVAVWCAAKRWHEAGLAAARAAGAREVGFDEALQITAHRGVVVVDAFTGIGSRPGLPGDVAAVARRCHERGVRVVAVDIPSGLDADLGVTHESFIATQTVTFGALKPCHVLEPAKSRCGRVVVVDIGIDIDVDEELLQQAELGDIAAHWPVPRSVFDKYARGVVLFDTGSEQYPGAALLGIDGALHAGTGMVRYIGPATKGLVLSRAPSVVVGDGRAQAMVIGSGWGTIDERRIAAAVERRLPVVADADALRCLPAGPLTGWLLTPHAGELARLLDSERDEVEAAPLTHARRAAERWGATVLLKGATQVIAEPDGHATIAVPGTAWTAAAGSGDVLAGICGALLAAGLQPWLAGVLGASVQAITAVDNPGPYPPDEIARRLPATIARLVGIGTGAG